MSVFDAPEIDPGDLRIARTLGRVAAEMVLECTPMQSTAAVVWCGAVAENYALDGNVNVRVMGNPAVTAARRELAWSERWYGTWGEADFAQWIICEQWDHLVDRVRNLLRAEALKVKMGDVA